MSDNEPQFSPDTLDSMSFEERTKYFLNQPVIDVTDGLHHLTHTSNELYELIQTLVEERNSGRLPILGTKDNKVWMIGGAVRRFEHAEIMRQKGIESPTDVTFSTSLAGISTDPIQAPCLVLTGVEDGRFFGTGDKSYIPLGKGSDLHGVKGISFPEDKLLIEKIFGQIKGVDLKL